MAEYGKNIRKRKDGRWEGRYLCGRWEDGRARYKYIYGKTCEEVQEKKRVLEEYRENQKKSTTQENILFSMLLDDWLVIMRTDVKESTFSRYVSIVEKHIKPELGDITLNSLTTSDIDHFTLLKLKEGRLDGRGGLSHKTVTDILSIIKLSLKFGKEREYDNLKKVIVKNPRQIKSKIQILMPEEQRRLEKKLFDTSDYINIGIIISLYTGLRIGEICALKWGDFDFSSATLYVQRTILRIPNTSSCAEHKTQIIIDRPKTECSNRRIPLPGFLIGHIKPYRKNDECYVLTGKNVFLEPRGYYRKYKHVLESCGLQQFNYHALRHTFATRCIESGFDVKSLSEILGHSNVSITMQRYVHPSMSLKRQYMNQLEDYMICGQNSGQIIPENV